MKISNSLSAQIRKAINEAKSDLHKQDVKLRDMVGCDIFTYLEENHWEQKHKGQCKKVLWRVVVEFSDYYHTEYGEYIPDIQYPMDKSICGTLAASIIDKRSVDDGDYVLSIDDASVAVNFDAFCKEADRKLLNKAKKLAKTKQGIYDEYFRLARGDDAYWY